MKKIIAAAVMALTATTATADQDQYGWLRTDIRVCVNESIACHNKNKPIMSNRPKAIDSVMLGLLKCNILAIKGWSTVISDNRIYEEITEEDYLSGSLWVKGDRYAHCIIGQVFLFNKADVDNFVKIVSEIRDERRKKSNESFTKGLDKL